jgi:tyrosyl-tRNA synthetase
VSRASRSSRPARARVPDEETLRRITTRSVAEIVPHQEFVDGLLSGRPLRLKMGFDPTKPVITLGWAVGLRKLRQLQDLGHTVVVIIGDWTARIGDPSEESQTRPMLTAEEVQANAQAILRQFYKVLDERRTEIRHQSEWFDKFDLTEVVRLAARFTVAQMLQRDDFAQRHADHKPIGLHELVYPLLQAYDSVAVEADVEFGGTDQKFNNLVGRELQRMLGQKAGPSGQGQAVFLVPLLVGLDGKQKMSQSLGNYIGIEESPHEMYGKLMSVPDSLMMDYFELLTDIPGEELAGIRKAVQEGGAQAMENKMRLAREIVSQFHSEPAAQEAEGRFGPRTIRVELEMVPMPGGTVQVPVSFGGKAEKLERLPQLLEKAGLVDSISDARRLIRQGSIEHIGFGDGRRLTKMAPTVFRKDRVVLRDGMVIRVGKHRFLRIVDADKHPQD